jgi:hypothetical protein
MRKYIFVIFALLAMAGNAFAAGTVVQSDSVVRVGMATVTLTCTADSSDGSYPATALDLDFVDGFYLYEVRTSPGATGPTDASDFTLTDSAGLDILGGAGTNQLDNTTDLRFFPKNSAGGYAYHAITDTTVTLTITNNSVNSAVTTITLIFVK